MCRRMTTSDGLQYAAWACLLCLLLLLASATAWASETPATYQITAAELTELQDNLSRLQLINDSLRQTCGLQQNRLVDLATALNRAEQQLATAQRQQTALQLQIRTLTENSQKQEALLTEANESFARYSKEQKRTRLRIKAQRNTWAAAAGLLAVGFALK